MQDTSRLFETPEGVSLELQLAGPVVRAVAWVMDFGIRAGIYISLGMFLPLLGELGVGVYLVGIFLIEWFYPVVFEVLKDGATPGKKSMGIKVVHDNGTPVSWPAAILRNLLRAADFMPLLYGFGLCAMLLNRDFKRLGDMAAGTLVIYSQKLPNAVKLTQIEPQAPPAGLLVPEQRAILDFAERYRFLSVDRCNELADILAPVTGKEPGANANELLKYANWLLGAGAVSRDDVE